MLKLGFTANWQSTELQEKSATKPEVWLCVSAATKHTFWKKIAMMDKTNGKE